MIRGRYNRLAALYDLMEWPPEIVRFDDWRGRLSIRISGSRALEVGVGICKNMACYPSDISVSEIPA
jgi:hypothetical protein